MKVGIDLGTTNSALAWIDPAQAEDTMFPPVHVFEIPQQVSAGRMEPRRTLPSFLLLDEEQPVGSYARDQGALLPTRLVHSAKSWLSNADVDRTAKILPWDSQDTGRVLSPVEVSARFLGVIREAWDRHDLNQGGKYGPLAEQDIVLTVPASFDEEARELTALAAAEAGLSKITLLEEPAAAFYAWIANNLAQSRKRLFDGQIVLICDVGGGTSDFSLIRVSRQGDEVNFTRTAVGKHLLLGGDNLDLTLAWLAESKLGKQLSIRQRSGLRRQCSAAKEKLLCDDRLDKVEIAIQGGGSSLVGGSLKTEILRSEALELALEGFLPMVPRGTLPKDEKRSLFRELGLPYVSDPAITKHIAEFLEAAGQTPDAILFNGGFFIPAILRTRTADVLANWYGKRPEIFDSRDLDLAVACGAAYYSYARSTGSGILVRGGLPRTYFIGTGEQALCLVARGTEEGSAVEVDRDDLQLVANKPVSFELFSSLTRTGDQPGDVVRFGEGEAINKHAPLQAVIRFGKSGERLIPVKLGARLTEVGTLETWCDSKISDQRWKLQFQLRKPAASESAPRAAAVVSEESLAKCLEMIGEVFSATAKSAITPEELPSKLEQALALGRNSWPSEVLRKFADRFLENAVGRRTSPAFEVRWLNLCGFCLRPGFGYPGDDFRVEQARRLYAGGIAFGNQVQNEAEWWIFWGRISGGLNRNQQVDIFQRLSQFLLPRGKKQRVNSSLLREMWRTAASLELLPVATRTELGDSLIKTGKAANFNASDLWCLSRLGARALFYGPVNQVLPPATVARWVEALLKAIPANPGNGVSADIGLMNALGDALVAMARKTGDPMRDVLPALTETVRSRIASGTGSDHLAAVLDSGEKRDDAALGRIFGEALPSGLVLVSAE